MKTLGLVLLILFACVSLSVTFAQDAKPLTTPAADAPKPEFVPIDRTSQLEIEKQLLLIQNAQARIELAQRDIRDANTYANALVRQLATDLKIDAAYLFDQAHRDEQGNSQMGFILPKK